MSFVRCYEREVLSVKKKNAVKYLHEYSSDEMKKGWLKEAYEIEVLVSAGELCYNKKGSIDQHFVLQLIPQCEIIMTLYEQGRGASFRNPRGFALLTQQSDSLYLDLICCQAGFGTHLMKNIISHAKDIGCKSVSLSAVVRLIPYYRKLGFFHGSTTDQVEKPQITRLAQACMDKPLIDVDNKVSDPVVQTFLNTLIKEGLMYDTDCTTIDLCNESGYKMVLPLQYARVSPSVVKATRRSDNIQERQELSYRMQTRASSERKNITSTYSDKKQNSTSSKKRSARDKDQDIQEHKRPRIGSSIKKKRS